MYLGVTKTRSRDPPYFGTLHNLAWGSPMGGSRHKVPTRCEFGVENNEYVDCEWKWQIF